MIGSTDSDTRARASSSHALEHARTRARRQSYALARALAGRATRSHARSSHALVSRGCALVHAEARARALKVRALARSRTTSSALGEKK